MTLPPGWESFRQSAIPRVRRELVAYQKTGTDIVVEVGGYRQGWVVRRGGKVIGTHPSAPRAIEWADKQPEVKT